MIRESSIGAICSIFTSSGIKGFEGAKGAKKPTPTSSTLRPFIIVVVVSPSNFRLLIIKPMPIPFTFCI
jgi:hypothetical protein